MLRVGIQDEHLDTAYFVHLDSIDLSRLVTSKEVPFTTQQEHDAAVSRQHELCHDTKFKDLSTLPPWRVVIMRPQGQEYIDVVLSYHHALMDGTAGRLFHERVLTQLINANANATSDGKFNTVLSFPQPPTMPVPQEECVPFSLAKMYMVKTLWNHFGPSFLRKKSPEVWSSAPTDFSVPYVTRIRAVDVDAETVKALLQACRAHSTTITGLIHGLVLAALAKRVESNALCGTTPITLRPYAQPPPEKLSVFITGHNVLFTEEMTAQMRQEPTDAKIWAAAAHVRAKLGEKLAELPQNDVMGMMHHVKDWKAFFRAKDGKPREHSWEVSNVGVLKAPENEKHAIIRIMFTNGVMITGACLAFNTASVAGGPLTIGMSWQDTVVDEDMAQGIAGDLEQWLDRFKATGAFLDAPAA